MDTRETPLDSISEKSRLLERLRSPRVLIILAGGLILLLLLRAFTGSDSRNDQSVFARHDLILIATQSASSGTVDLHVVIDGQEPDRENRVLRAVTLEPIFPVLAGLGDLAFIDIADALGESSGLALPVQDGFLVHARGSSSAEVWFVGSGGEAKTVQLFSSNRTLAVSYAPGSDVLLVREESDDDFRCYRGSSSVPVERVGRGDGCWLGVDGAIAIVRRESDDLRVVHLAKGSQTESELTLRNAVTPSGSLNARSVASFVDSSETAQAEALVVMGLWASDSEFSYVESSGRLSSIVRISLPDGDEVYRSRTWAIEDSPVVVLDPRGPRIVGNLEEELPEVVLTSGGPAATEIARARTAILAHPLADGRILYSEIDRFASSGETRVDVFIWDGQGGSENARTLVEDVTEWLPLDSSVLGVVVRQAEALIALRENGDVILVDLSGSRAPQSLGIDGAEFLLAASELEGDDGRLTIITESSRGLNVDVWDGEEARRLIGGWLRVDGISATSDGYLVIGVEVAGDSDGVFLIKPGSRDVDRLFRAPRISGLAATSNPDVFYVNAADASDAAVLTLHRLDVAEKSLTNLGRGRYVVQTGAAVRFEGISASRPQDARVVMLFDQCKDSYAGRLGADARIEIPLDGGSTACWLWESPPGDDPVAFVWLHANEFSGTIELATGSGFTLTSYSTSTPPYLNPLRRFLPTAMDNGTPLFVLVNSSWDPGTVHTAVVESASGAGGFITSFPTITAPPLDQSCSDSGNLSYEKRAECLAGGVAVVNDPSVDSRSLRYRSAQATIRSLTTEAFATRASDFRIDRFQFEYCQPDARRIDRHLCYFTLDLDDPNRRAVISLSSTVGPSPEFFSAELFCVDSRGFRRSC